MQACEKKQHCLLTDFLVVGHQKRTGCLNHLSRRVSYTERVGETYTLPTTTSRHWLIQFMVKFVKSCSHQPGYHELLNDLNTAERHSMTNDQAEVLKVAVASRTSLS